MIQAIAEKLGLKVKPAIMAWAATIGSIHAGRADIVSSMGWSKTRANAMLLTDPVYYGGLFVAMRKDRPSSDRMDVLDLKGAVVGAIAGTNYALDLKRIPGIKELKLYDSLDSCIRDILAGRVDYASLDSMSVDYFLLQKPEVAIKQLPTISNPEYPYVSGKFLGVLGMSLDNPDLFDAVNAGVKWLWATKKTAEILVQNGMTSPAYLIPPADDLRIGVDRDASGNILGPSAHVPKDFSALFA